MSTWQPPWSAQGQFAVTLLPPTQASNSVMARPPPRPGSTAALRAGSRDPSTPRPARRSGLAGWLPARPRPCQAMNTATRAPETHELEGDDARNTLRRTGGGRLATDSFQHFRTAHSLRQLQSLPVARGSRIHSVGASVPSGAWCTSDVGPQRRRRPESIRSARRARCRCCPLRCGADHQLSSWAAQPPRDLQADTQYTFASALQKAGEG
jgi:hypothetical protein